MIDIKVYSEEFKKAEKDSEDASDISTSMKDVNLGDYVPFLQFQASMVEHDRQCQIYSIRDQTTKSQVELELKSERVEFQSSMSTQAIKLIKDLATENVYILEGNLQSMLDQGEQ